jgi:hypothetical protein
MRLRIIRTVARLTALLEAKQQVPALPHVRREREAVMVIEVAVLPLMP